MNEFLIRGEKYLERHENFKLVGRDEELKKLSAILIRNKANSIILTGPGGVGCSTLCLGLQALKAEPDAPFDIVSKRLFWLEIDKLFSSGDSAQINAAFNQVMETLNRTPDSVLIVEDTRDFIDAARNVGSMHFVNALVSAVRHAKKGRGHNGEPTGTQVIFETRDEDLVQVLKCHSDMRETFTLIDLREPAKSDLLTIVSSAAKGLEAFHNIKISSEAIETAIELTSKYRVQDLGLSRAQPERSVTLLDRALSSYRLRAHRNLENIDELKALYRKIRNDEEFLIEQQQEFSKAKAEYDEKKKRAEKTEEDGTKPRFSNPLDALKSGAGFLPPELARLNQEIQIAQTEISKSQAQYDAITSEINSKLELGKPDVLREFSSISGVSVEKLTEDDYEMLRNLEATLKKHIFGQDHAVEKLTNAVKRARVSNRERKAPISFMFLGPSGVGKSEIAKRLAQELELPLTILDMSDYMEKHAVAKMIGAPPGYEGFEAGGILTNTVRNIPSQVVLFDEIEKAHADVFNVLLQVLGDGRLNDNLGREVSFRDVICLFTTNIGQPYFLDPANTFEMAEELTFSDLTKTYRPEFLNRFSGRRNIVGFKSLDLASIEKIAMREMKIISDAFINQGISIEVDHEALENFCKDYYTPMTGARGIPAILSETVEGFLVNAILDNPDKKRRALVGYNVNDKALTIDLEDM